MKVMERIRQPTVLLHIALMMGLILLIATITR
jgi:hypothetical protein